MAILTTYVTLGWYGIEDESPCTSLSLTQLIGTYDASGNFIQGSSGLTESEAKSVQFNTLSVNGGPERWGIDLEESFRNTIPSVITMDSLECGRMYWIYNESGKEVNIPQFVPTADGVDIGRFA